MQSRMQTIFFVTTVSLPSTWSGRRRSSRTWGFYFTLEDAEHAVYRGDSIYESGSYQYAVIEEFPEGVSEQARSMKWFEITHDKEHDTHTAKPLDKAPERLARICNWAVG